MGQRAGSWPQGHPATSFPRMLAVDGVGGSLHPWTRCQKDQPLLGPSRVPGAQVHSVAFKRPKGTLFWLRFRVDATEAHRVVGTEQGWPQGDPSPTHLAM